MNSIRRRIEWKRQSLIDSAADGILPEICKRDIPPEMPDNFMARADEIRTNAANSLRIYKANDEYLWCKEHYSALTPKELDRSCVGNILGYVSGLEAAIASDDLITMRRHENPERYLESFGRGVQEINRILSARENDPQMNFFSAVSFDKDGDETEFDEEEQDLMM